MEAQVAGAVGAARRSGGAARSAGYTLAALIIIITILSVAAAVVLPLYERTVQRQREEEAIFRGLQYAEAIRVFQQRFGRLPNKLDELLEVEPRSIRQLWTDPLNGDRPWGVVYSSGVTSDELEGEKEKSGVASNRQFTAKRQAAGPIVGVYSRASGQAIRLFMGEDIYKQWLFTVELLPRPAPLSDGSSVSRANATWTGRPFRPGIDVEQGAGLEAGQQLDQGGGPKDRFADDEDDEGDGPRQ